MTNQTTRTNELTELGKIAKPDNSSQAIENSLYPITSGIASFVHETITPDNMIFGNSRLQGFTLSAGDLPKAGLIAIGDLIQQTGESRLMQQLSDPEKNTEQVIKAAKFNKFAAAIGTIPMLASALIGTTILATPIGIYMTPFAIVRYLGGLVHAVASKSTEKQVEFLGADRNKRKAMAKSDSWLNSEFARELPKEAAGIREFGTKAMGYISVVVSVFDLFSGNLLNAGFFGAQAVYNFWAGKRIENYKKVYQNLEKQTEDLLYQTIN